ncbi:hypothetical protein LCGC14_2624130 [marine sediment metagenome]|uniref:Uncharacterized protein n=1 Tax=marine sediment metagenome TaxID=412755 RepID=A0A0F9A2B8_9ZZZZ
MNEHEQFMLAQKCINKIDDFCEYRYRVSGSHVRDVIMGYIDDYGVLVATARPEQEQK